MCGYVQYFVNNPAERCCALLVYRTNQPFDENACNINAANTYASASHFAHLEQKKTASRSASALSARHGHSVQYMLQTSPLTESAPPPRHSPEKSCAGAEKRRNCRLSQLLLRSPGSSS